MELPLPYRKMIYSNSCDERMAIKSALEYLPDNILEKWQDSIAIVTMEGRHGIRIHEELSKNKQLVFLSDKIWPPRGAIETGSCLRFFIFVILHEIAHIELKHSSQNKTEEEYEADKMAKEWFNDHVQKINQSESGSILKPLTCKEIEGNKDFVEGRDWTYNSRKDDLSGFVCIKLYPDEITSVFKRAENEQISPEVLLRRLIRDLLGDAFNSGQ